jgi:fucose permease
MAGYVGAMAGFNRDVRLVFIADIGIGFILFGGIHAVLLNLYLLRMGFTMPQVGLVNSAGFLTVSVFALLAGAVEAMLSPKKALIVGLGSMVVSLLLLSLADLSRTGERCDGLFPRVRHE